MEFGGFIQFFFFFSQIIVHQDFKAVTLLTLLLPACACVQSSSSLLNQQCSFYEDGNEGSQCCLDGPMNLIDLKLIISLLDLTMQHRCEILNYSIHVNLNSKGPFAKKNF